MTLVPGFVIVQDLHPEEWQAEEEAGHATRTSYETKDHTELACPYVETGKTCTLFYEESQNAKVSYNLKRFSYPKAPDISMLALNRLTRAEAVPIFYGKNEIYFTSMSAVLPFLEDRTELSLQSMHYLHLEMEVDRLIYQKRRAKGWARTFAEFSKFESLKLQKLTVCVQDPELYYNWGLKLHTKLERWVHKLAENITNLDMLGVIFNFSTIGEQTPDEYVKKDSPTEDILWEFLAPKMLKKIGNGPHDAHSLLKRRIRDEEYEYGFSEGQIGFIEHLLD